VGTARGAHAALIRELGATPIDHQREDFTRVLPAGLTSSSTASARTTIAARSRRSARRAALRLRLHGGRTTATSPARDLDVSARVNLWRLLLSWLRRKAPPRLLDYAMRALHPPGFGGPGAALRPVGSSCIRPRIAERILFDEVAEAHRRIEEAVSTASWCCARTSRRDTTGQPRLRSESPDCAVRTISAAKPGWPLSVVNDLHRYG